MSTGLGIFLFIVLVAVITLIRVGIRKGANAAATALNTKVLFREEHEEEQQLVKETLIFTTHASPEDIMRRIRQYVSPQTELPVARRVVYELSSSSSLVTYAYGNKLYPKLFVAAIGFSNNGTTVRGTFDFIRWTKREGMLLNADDMKDFRKAISKAFSDADPGVRISGAPSGVTNGAVEERYAAASDASNATADAANSKAQPKPAEPDRVAYFSSRDLDRIVCPVCQKPQMASRDSCYSCGCTFIYQDEQAPAPPMWVCACGQENAGDESFCGKCGTKRGTEASVGSAASNVAATQPVDIAWTCACGTQNEADDAFCGICGKKRPTR